MLVKIQYSENPQNIEGRILKDLCTNNDKVKNEYVALFLTKYKDWQYENEVRCFFQPSFYTNILVI